MVAAPLVARVLSAIPKKRFTLLDDGHETA
jgi:hypothetical protein